MSSPQRCRAANRVRQGLELECTRWAEIRPAWSPIASGHFLGRQHVHTEPVGAGGRRVLAGDHRPCGGSPASGLLQVPRASASAWWAEAHPTWSTASGHFLGRQHVHTEPVGAGGRRVLAGDHRPCGGSPASGSYKFPGLPRARGGLKPTLPGAPPQVTLRKQPVRTDPVGAGGTPSPCRRSSALRRIARKRAPTSAQGFTGLPMAL